jgi:DNA-binding LytR/AlgR family response regulator
MTLNTLIVDDDPVTREAVRMLISKHQDLRLIAACETTEEAFRLLSKGDGIDLVCLDIEMPEGLMSGLQLLENLDNAPQVIMMSTKPDYGASSYETGAVVDYIVKPVTDERFAKALQRVRANTRKPVLDTQTPEDIFIKTDNRIIRLRLSDIFFVEALSDYVIIHTEKKKHIVHSTMKGMEQKLPNPPFLRVHRSYIVNARLVESIDEMGVVMPQKTIPIGASYKNDFLNKLRFL